QIQRLQPCCAGQGNPQSPRALPRTGSSALHAPKRDASRLFLATDVQGVRQGVRTRLAESQARTLSVMAGMSLLDPKRTVAELKELRALTGDSNGAQRVAFTPTWTRARDWLRQKTAGPPLEIHNDAAGNTWFTLHGQS